MHKKMKSGYTTGSCAAAGTKAAILALQGNIVNEVDLYALSGELLHIPIKNIEFTEHGAKAEVIKDGGDDPDITHGSSVFTEVVINPQGEMINFHAGLGIGKVTQPGLSVAPGQPAINPGPRKMMTNVVRELLPKNYGCDITISIPKGVELAKKTLAIHNIQNVENIVKLSEEKVDDPLDKTFFNIVSVGRIVPSKRFDRIPFIARQLKNMGLSFRWYIIGEDNMGGVNDKLQKELNKLDVKDCVICCGSRLNPYPYIASANLLVLPSSYEACPRVVIEAKILKTPVICTDFSSATEFVENNIDGFIEKIDCIFKPISEMISNKELYNRIKCKCIDYRLDNEIIMNHLLAVFSENSK